MNEWKQQVFKCICDKLLTNESLFHQEYSVQLTFREQWTDERLKFDDIGGKQLKKYFNRSSKDFNLVVKIAEVVFRAKKICKVQLVYFYIFLRLYIFILKPLSTPPETIVHRRTPTIIPPEATGLPFFSLSLSLPLSILKALPFCSRHHLCSFLL